MEESGVLGYGRTLAVVTSLPYRYRNRNSGDSPMKRRREKVPKAVVISGSKTPRSELVSSHSAQEDAGAHSCRGEGVMPAEGTSGRGGSRGKSERKAKEKSGIAQLANFSVKENTPHIVDFNDNFPDEILVQVFKHVFRPENAWESAKVCKRWHVLQAISLLQKRSNGSPTGGFRCMNLKKGERNSGRKSHCDGKTISLKLKKVESEWRLSLQLLQSCKRHIHQLEIKNCNYVSQRGYQLITAFASNLKSIRLEACNTLDDTTFDLLMEKSRALRSVHLAGVPHLTLVNMVAKAPQLQEVHVHGCGRVTVKTMLAILHGLTNLRSLNLTAMREGSHDWDSSKFETGPPLRLEHLHLENSPSVTDRLLKALAPRLLNLKKLDLTLCTLITNEGLKALIRSSGVSLTSLVLKRCRQISDEGMITLMLTAMKLRDVTLAGCGVSDTGMEAFMKGKFIKTLRNLSLACCNKLSDSSLLHFASREADLASFKCLDLQGCAGISAFGLKQLPPKLRGKKYRIISEKKNVTISE
ncbi:hypothetical protein R1flu_020212 [Riccia fluitans]|uniref:F-box/LRR-repeat protein 15-like leucin rich repeat domain-containing protein n=1 Tax=Riccia fluitans TaxID=41844 RepID=A0ABD1ZPP7_9MARC